MKTMEIIKLPTEALCENKSYRDLVPRHNEKDYRRLKENIADNGLDPRLPIVVNKDLVVLDGYGCLQIARELGLERVWVMVQEFEDRYEEQKYILLAAVYPTHSQRLELMNEEVVDLEQAARLFGVTPGSMRQVQTIKEAAQADPEIAAAWDKMARGEASGYEAAVKQLYDLAVEKN